METSPATELDNSDAVVIEKITLSQGELSFTALAAGKGQAVLFLHGFPDTPATFTPQICALANAGYRVIALYLRGYEPSSQPHDKKYLPSAIALDVLACLDELGESQVHLVGHDWGAGVAQIAALRNPERFLSLTIMAVPNLGRFLRQAYRYPRQLKKSWYMAFFQLAGISDWVVRRNNFHFLEYLWRKWSPGWQAPESMLEELKKAFSKPGVVPSALSYYRQVFSLLSSDARRYRELARQPCLVPTLALTGSQDGCIDSRVFRACMREEDYPNGMRCLEFPGVGHFLHLEEPGLVSEALLQWFSQAGAGGRRESTLKAQFNDSVKLD